MTTVEILRAARSKIEKEENWTQEELAVTGDGIPVMPWNPAAAAWCAVGAIQAIKDKGVDLVRDCYQPLRDAAAPQSISDYNDTHTHAEVLDLFDRAIRIAGE